MFKNTGKKLASALLLLLLANPAVRAFASSKGPNANSPAVPTTFPTLTADGITGTDPEPIDPGIVSIILTLLNLR